MLPNTTSEADRGSDLCSRNQHASSGHPECFVLVSRSCAGSANFYHPLARDAGLVALAATRTPSDLWMMATVWMQRVLGHAAWVCLCQSQVSGSNVSSFHLGLNAAVSRRWCAVASVVLSARAGRGAVDRYGGRRNDGWCVRALSVSRSH